MNPYTVLNVGENATEDELKKAYRTQCKRYHPDLNNGSAVAEEKFKQVQSAYADIQDRRSGKSSSPYAYSPYGQPHAPYGQSASEDNPFSSYADFRHYYATSEQRQRSYSSQQPQENEPTFVFPRFNFLKIIFYLWVFRFVLNLIGFNF